jgi:Cys-tRNA(Pro)/Cys-tRNA(Cys) deacylase
MKQIAKASASKKAEMADGALVERSTGYVLGGVSPLGQKRLHLTILDKSATYHETIFVSAGRRGVEIELQPKDLLQLTEGKLFDIIQQ